MATVYVSDPNSKAARRRLSLITFCLFVSIVILTTYTFYLLHDNDFDNDEGSSKNHHYTAPLHPSSNHLQATAMRRPFTKGTLTRYGTNLKLNSRCPEGSLMTSAKADAYRHSKGKTNKCPKVFIIGAKKGGTTSLYQYLSMHPNFKGIRINNSKWVGETFYFAQKYGKVSLNSYLHQFPKGKMSGDASVDNLLHCKASVRILKTCGGNNVKIIVLLRHPIQRYVSNFMMRVTGGTYQQHSNSSSIHDQLMFDIKLLKKRLNGRPVPHRASEWSRLLCLFECCQNILYEGFYYAFVMNWLCNFPKENILFVNSEEMFWRPALILKQVLDFVGLRPLNDEVLYEITSHVYNKGVKPFLPQHHISPSDQELLLSYYSSFNDGILDLLSWQEIDWSSHAS